MLILQRLFDFGDVDRLEGDAPFSRLRLRRRVKQQ
jgi:hypothetical protein